MAGFATTVTPEERLHAQEWLERSAKRKVGGCLVMGVAYLGFVVIKVAALQVVGLALLPLVLLPLTIHHFTGRRFWKVRSGGHLIVWLRRFGREDLRRFPFGRILMEACSDHSTPLTIQDSTYRFSHTSLLAKGTFTFCLVALYGVLAGVLLLAAVLGIASWIIEGTGLAEEWIVLPVLFALPLPFVIPFKFVRRACYQRLRAGNAVEKVAATSARIRRGRCSTALQIAQCGDGFWRDAVRESLRQASAVVVDVTAIGRNVRWELETVRSSLPPARVLLVSAAAGGEPLMGEVELLAELEKTLGREYFGATRRMTYELPAPRPWVVECFQKRCRDFMPWLYSESRQAFVELQGHLVSCLQSPPALRVVGSETGE